MISSFPYKLDNTVLPFPDSPPEMGYSEVENTSVSETGKDIVQSTRIGKLSMTFTYQLPGGWMNIFDTIYNANDVIEVSMPNSTGTAYEKRNMRMRKYSKTLVKGSETLADVTAGVWRFKFTLIEM